MFFSSSTSRLTSPNDHHRYTSIPCDASDTIQSFGEESEISPKNTLNLQNTLNLPRSVKFPRSKSLINERTLSEENEITILADDLPCENGHVENNRPNLFLYDTCSIDQVELCQEIEEEISSPQGSLQGKQTFSERRSQIMSAAHCNSG